MTRIRTQIFADSFERRLPWVILLLLLLLGIMLVGMGWWRGTAVGPQVQVPMFYDAHYLFPRPWTLEQAAPGVPEPAPLAFYGANHVSQSFVSAVDRLTMVEVWLAGTEGTAVEVSLAAEAGSGTTYSGQVMLDGGRGRYYRFHFPVMVDSAGQRFRLTVAAPEATAEQPVITRTVGGDRLDGVLQLNEFTRPGNMELYSYVRGFPGRWWLAAVGEQLLPNLFRLRLQQYKPPLFKGPFFSGLLVSFLGLTFGFLVLSRPSGMRFIQALGWSIGGVLAAFLIWQIGSGRVRLPLLIQPVQLATAETPLPIAPSPGTPRLVQDLALSLWTAERLPQAYLATTELNNGLSAIRVPADAEIGYQLTLPPGSRLRVGFAAVGEGQIEAAVTFGEQLLVEAEATAEAESGTVEWLEVDLSGLAGQTGTLRLITDTDGRPPLAHDEPPPDSPQGLWIMPQIMTDAAWLLPDPLPETLDVQTAAYRFDSAVELVGYKLEPAPPQRGETVSVTLYWRLLRDVGEEYIALQPLYPTIFVHLLDDAGQIQAQHDAPPVGGIYPVADWQPGTIIADRHELQLPPEAVLDNAQLAVGLYDPDTLERWLVTDVNGVTQPDGRALLPFE